VGRVARRVFDADPGEACIDGGFDRGGDIRGSLAVAVLEVTVDR
jgi:hypothetical protein